jgi:UrcA family protein
MLSPDRIIAYTVASALFAVLVLSPTEFLEAATNGDQAPSVVVKYRSGDLETAPGIAALYRRIRNAAKSVCGPFDGALVEEKVRWNECVNQSVTSAVTSAHNQSLSAYHSHQNRRWKRPSPEAPTALATR